MKFANKIALRFIKIYQSVLSPDHSFWARALGKSHCRYYPTCSTYGCECYERFGFWYATRLTIVRILKCHPWAKGGMDLPPGHSKSQEK